MWSLAGCGRTIFASPGRSIWGFDGRAKQQDAQKARQPAFAEASARQAKARGSEAPGLFAEAYGEGGSVVQYQRRLSD
jgi:hypothetical protein